MVISQRVIPLNLTIWFIPLNFHGVIIIGEWNMPIIELDYGKIYRKALYLMVKTMVSCRFSLKPIQ
jgi:hypothetical protein